MSPLPEDVRNGQDKLTFLPEQPVDLREVAGALGTTVRSLVRRADRGSFPAVFRVARGRYVVEKADLESWAARQWRDPERAAVRRAAFGPAKRLAAGESEGALRLDAF